MARIKPIRGVRFSPHLIDELDRLITPPYDVISPEAQEAYYQKSPYNVIRLEYGKSLPDDRPGNDKYTRAAATFQKWLAEGALLQEKEPALYLYEQHYRNHQQTYIRKGLYCGVGLSPFEAGEIVPHEKTMDKPKADRLELLRHCEANFSPVFGLYRDKEQFVAAASSSFKENQKPVLDAEDEDGHLHRLWAVTDPGFIETITGFFKDKNIFIADGHHRYETALQFYLEKKKEGTEAPGYAHVLMALVNIYDEGLLVFPTHRLLKQEQIDSEHLLKELKHSFLIQELPEPGGPAHLQDLLARNLTNNLRQLRLGLYTPGKKLYLLTFKERERESNLYPWLDTVVLQEIIFSKIFALGDIENSPALSYLKDEWEAKAKVDSGEANYAFFLTKPPLEKIIDLAGQGIRMPQKSTFFYPKFMTGIVIHKLS
ncbi:MAG: DUF1015 domain-containing protein [Dethiobacteria bacterium]|jgi:uncharacterized protein (DUF1015 family)